MKAGLGNGIMSIGMSLFRGFRASQTPVTLGLAVAIGASFLLAWFGLRGIFFDLLAFQPDLALGRPWTFLTYPISSLGDGNSLIGVVFLIWWLLGIGSVVEQDMSSPRYGIFLAVMTVLASVCAFVGSLFAPGGYLVGAYVLAVAVTVVWGTRYPHSTIQFMMVIPIKAMWVAWLSVAILFFGTNNLVLAVFSVIPMGLAYLFAANKLPVTYNKPYAYAHKPSKRQLRQEKEYYDDVKRRERQREERERLRQLFERSLIEDPDDDGGKKDKA